MSIHNTTKISKYPHKEGEFYGISKLRPEIKVDNKLLQSDLQTIYTNIMKTKKTSIKKTIGQGGQAKVRKFYSDKFKKTLVEKVINISASAKATLGPQGILDAINLCKEAILLSGLNHPNVVKVYDFIKDPPTIIMEYCEKGSLRNILNKFDLPPLYKIFLIYSICDGLKYVHSKGIVHGDLKCDNILLSNEKKFFIGKYYYPIPKLADFGLGQFHPNDVKAGTPGFIAPEIFKGSGLNFKTDVFALGMVMFEILSGLRPLPSNPEIALSILKQGKIPCTKEILRKAWKLRSEELLPGIENPFYDAFYTIMINCIDEDPKYRPPVSEIYLIVKKLYQILKEVAKEKYEVESNVSY